MPFSAGYTLDLYCQYSRPIFSNADFKAEAERHSYNEFPHEFLGETWGQCKAKAVKKGWVFHRNGEVTCPKCKDRKRPATLTAKEDKP